MEARAFHPSAQAPQALGWDVGIAGSVMKLQSHTITQGRDRAPARAMLKGIGFTDEDLAKPIIGVANTWIETMPCNYNLRELAVKVKEGMIFNVIRSDKS